MQKPNNFRDLGGIKTADGRTVRHGLLLRAAQPVGLSHDDLAALAPYNIANVVDFRRPWEVNLAPIDDIHGAKYSNLDVMSDMPHVEESLEEWMAALSHAYAETHMKESYLQYAKASSANRAFSDFLHICANTDGAVLFHCHAGKDRTGMAAAILLKILGAGDNDIFDDYLKTMADVEKRLPAKLEEHRAGGLDEDKIAALAVIYSVKREYLESALATINATHGSFENYLQNALGITDAMVEKLKAIYLH